MYNSPIKIGHSVDGGMGFNKTFPFIFNFISKDDDTWDVNKGAASMGVTVPAQGRVKHVIHTSEDYNFKLLFLHYTVYYYDSRAGTYSAWEIDPGVQYIYGDTALGDPYTAYIKVAVAFQPDSETLMGHPPFTTVTPGVVDDCVPVPIEVIQDDRSGIGMVRTPYILPRNGNIMFDIFNRHPTKDLIVGGCAQGIKIRL